MFIRALSYLIISGLLTIWASAQGGRGHRQSNGPVSRPITRSQSRCPKGFWSRAKRAKPESSAELREETHGCGYCGPGGQGRGYILASGEIGEVVIYSDEKKSFIDECIDVVKKIKFIPAREDGKAVDSVQTVSYILNFL
jgi:hypothetical protein